MIKDLGLRILAVFVLDALGTVGAASIWGINAFTAGSIAGLMAITVVFQDIARAYLKDGKLTKAEIDEAFSKAAEKE